MNETQMRYEMQAMADEAKTIEFDCQDFNECELVAVWPDGTECLLTDISEYSWMSDDYQVVSKATDLT